MQETLKRLFQYKAWANDTLLTALAGLGEESPVTTLAVKALSHTHVVDRIFAAHLRHDRHSYASANLDRMPALTDLSGSSKASTWRVWERRQVGCAGPCGAA